MSRVQLALSVTDVGAAVDFYSKLFATPPAKVRPGYANFAITDPPVKLVLIEDASKACGSLNHLGIEVDTTAEVVAATRRLAAEGLETAVEDGVTCCYAVQDKVWVRAPDGEPWEIYTVLEDAGIAHGHDASDHGTSHPCDTTGCCGPRQDQAARASASGCC